MHITRLELQNFKRFTHLTLDGIPPSNRLVLLTGSNGSGKSSVFDGLEVFNAATKKDLVNGGERYYKKDLTAPLRVSFEESGSLSTIGDGVGINLDRFDLQSFYGRSSLRQIPRLTRTQLGVVTDNGLEDSDRPKLFIDRDNRFENDIIRASRQIITEIFRGDASSSQIRVRYVNPINDALSRIFDGQDSTRLSLIEIIPPGEGEPAQINFSKGQSEVHYDLLSAGEKEVFNILFNLLIRKNQYTDSIYFFDEIDLHLNTQLQYNLLREIMENWLPQNCQLWTASHSLGFIDYARHYEQGVIFDLDDLNFDQPQHLFPQPKESLEVYDIAVPQSVLKQLMKGKRLVICENQNDQYYNLTLIPDTVFVGVKDAHSVFLHVKRDSNYWGLRDRDFLSDSEIERIQTKYPNYRILRYYDFENYIYHPDNITELKPPGFDRSEYIADITRQKTERLPYILANLSSSRQTYEEFKTDDVLKDEKPDAIVDDFQSQEFERFYKFFDMKAEYNKTYIMPFNLSKERLVQTNWFRGQMRSLLT